MRKIREALRLKALGQSPASIARSLDIGENTVRRYLRRADEASMTWPLDPELGDAALEARLFPPPPATGTARAVPDWAKVKRELRRKGVTLQLRLDASVEDIDFRSPRGLDKSVVLRLAGCDWIRNHQVVLVVGATGTGKSYLACALAHAACRHGLSTRYFRLSRLLDDLVLARADGSYPKLLERLAKTQLIVLDDYGMAPLNGAQRRDLLELLDDRYGQRASLLTSQLPIEHWHDVIGEPTFADAILDRLVHHAHRITLKGPSMRKKKPASASSADPAPA